MSMSTPPAGPPQVPSSGHYPPPRLDYSEPDTCQVTVDFPHVLCNERAVDEVQLFDRMMRMKAWVFVCERHLAEYRNKSMKKRVERRTQTGA